METKFQQQKSIVHHFLKHNCNKCSISNFPQSLIKIIELFFINIIIKHLNIQTFNSNFQHWIFKLTSKLSIYIILRNNQHIIEPKNETIIEYKLMAHKSYLSTINKCIASICIEIPQLNNLQHKYLCKFNKTNIFQCIKFKWLSFSIIFDRIDKLSFLIAIDSLSIQHNNNNNNTIIYPSINYITLPTQIKLKWIVNAQIIIDFLNNKKKIAIDSMWLSTQNNWSIMLVKYENRLLFALTPLSWYPIKCHQFSAEIIIDSNLCQIYKCIHEFKFSSSHDGVIPDKFLDIPQKTDVYIHAMITMKQIWE